MKIILAVLALLITYCSLLADEACWDFKRSYSIDKGNIADLPASSSFLKDAKDTSRYTAEKAFDGKIETSWVEGRADDGIGESIAFYIDEIKEIRILPGYGDPAYFKKNNRVKKASFAIFSIKEVHPTQCAIQYVFDVKPVYKKILLFSDAMELQPYKIDFGQVNEKGKGFIGVITIEEVFRGSSWRDTCIAEIQVIK
jgi:hypothetical protein